MSHAAESLWGPAHNTERASRTGGAHDIRWQESWDGEGGVNSCPSLRKGWQDLEVGVEKVL